jgi:hypothetical protein
MIQDVTPNNIADFHQHGMGTIRRRLVGLLALFTDVPVADTGVAKAMFGKYALGNECDVASESDPTSFAIATCA